MRRGIISDLRNIFIIFRFDLTERTGPGGVSVAGWAGDTKGRKLLQYPTVISPPAGFI